MKQVQLIHNPGAGDEEHSKNELKELLESNGYSYNYTSTKKDGWKDFDRSADIVLIAGGDGTIRKVAEELFKESFIERPDVLAILPLGTANNISRSLGITGDADSIIRSWDRNKTKGFDIGRLYNVDDVKFFMESFGYGVFPYLMQEIKKKTEEKYGSPAEKINKALELLYLLIQQYEAKDCVLEVDGKDHSGKFILAEVMNIPSIGPNLNISPTSDPGDGVFEVVLVPDEQKDQFLNYIKSKLEGREESYTYQTFQGKDISIKWEGTHVHVDDQVVKLGKGEEVRIKLKKNLLEFMV